MKTTFYTYVALMVALMFSMPSLSFAEQHQVENIIIIAKQDAERDANLDVNKQLWFAAGMIPVCLVSIPTILTVFDAKYYQESSTFIRLNYISPFVGTVSALLYSPSPPTQRFIGKSPEYISAYTDAYKSKARWIRVQMAASGAATGCVVSIAGCIFYMNKIDYEFSLGPTF